MRMQKWKHVWRRRGSADSGARVYGWRLLAEETVIRYCIIIQEQPMNVRTILPVQVAILANVAYQRLQERRSLRPFIQLCSQKIAIETQVILASPPPKSLQA